MTEIARRATTRNNRVTFLIHRREVLDQAVKAFESQDANPELSAADMVQTLMRRAEKLSIPDVILVDKTHHALAKSYQNILDKFPKAIVLLFTATPHRTGRQQLDQIADDIIVGQSIHELIEKGFLAPFKYFQPLGSFDEKALKRGSTGDYTAESMQETMSTRISGHIVKQYKRIASGIQAVVYTYSIDSAIKIANEFSSERISTIEVGGTTSKEKRNRAVRKFQKKRLQISVNINLFTEGVDLPNVDCVIIARPTASLALYLQFSVRCLNPRPGKTTIIINHANNFKKFGYPNDGRGWKQAVRSGKQKDKTLLKDSGLSVVTCDYCFAVVKVSGVEDGKCPICSKPIKVHETKPISDADLVKATKARRERIKKIIQGQVIADIAGKSVGELKSMSELVTYGKLHGYKPGWACFIAKRKGIFK